MTRRTLLLPLLLVGLLLTGCTGDDTGSTPDPGEPTGQTDGSPTTSTPTPPPTATPAPVPGNRKCRALDFDEAVAPTSPTREVDCSGPHTALTFHVGDLDTVLDGHLIAVDSDRVQDQVATECPERFARFVGGTEDEQRLSMLRTVWFTPSVEESDDGANWYRCDVVALRADERLAPLTGRLAGVLARPEGRDRYAMCGTAEPGTPEFARVICSTEHAWRAITTIDFEGQEYPGLPVVRDDGQQRCEDLAGEAADDPLGFQWGYEWPTAKQWRDGQTYGLCWAPD